MSTTSSRFAYKELPKFEPRYYRQWASIVKDAFAERDWNNYLVTPAPTITPAVIAQDDTTITPSTTTPFRPDPSISARAKAFLSQSIEYKYQPSIETCTSAAEIWTVFLQRYGQRSRDDELRLEAEMLSLTKLSTQTLDEFIEKFDDLLSSIRAQQDPSQHWDDPKINMYFIRCLVTSRLAPLEDWEAWSTYLGSTYQTMTHDMLQSACRTYYASHFAVQKPIQSHEYVYAATTSPTRTTSTQSTPRGRGRGTDQQTRGRGTDQPRGKRSGNPRRKLPRDPNAWCTHCEMNGHSVTVCFNKFRQTGSTADFEDWCALQTKKPAPPPTPSAPSRSPQPAKDHGRSYTVRSHDTAQSCHCRLTSSPTDSWIYDSACTEHMTDCPSYFTTYDTFETPIDVHGINGQLQALGEGSVVITDKHGYTQSFQRTGQNKAISKPLWTQTKTSTSTA
jgi:hypothetical protein